MFVLLTSNSVNESDSQKNVLLYEQQSHSKRIYIHSMLFQTKFPVSFAFTWTWTKLESLFGEIKYEKVIKVSHNDKSHTRIDKEPLMETPFSNNFNWEASRRLETLHSLREKIRIDDERRDAKFCEQTRLLKRRKRVGFIWDVILFKINVVFTYIHILP